VTVKDEIDQARPVYSLPSTTHANVSQRDRQNALATAMVMTVVSESLGTGVVRGPKSVAVQDGEETSRSVCGRQPCTVGC
jgi:hypothetical protein